MKKNKRQILKILIILLIIIIGIVVVFKLIANEVAKKESFKLNVNNSDINDNKVVNSEENMEWNEITENGVNQKLLLQNVNTKDLEKISTLLQSLSAEIAQKEKEDINFYLSAG